MTNHEYEQKPDIFFIAGRWQAIKVNIKYANINFWSDNNKYTPPIF